MELPKVKSLIINIKNSLDIFGQTRLTRQLVNYHIYISEETNHDVTERRKEQKLNVHAVICRVIAVMNWMFVSLPYEVYMLKP